MSALDEIYDIQFVDNTNAEAAEAKAEAIRIVKELEAELTTLRDDKLKLEIAARDFLRAFAMRGQLLPSEFSEARDTLAAMVGKGEE